MISKETMRTVLIAAQSLLSVRGRLVRSIEWDIKMRSHTAETTKSAGARTRAQNEIAELQSKLASAQALMDEVNNAITELRATDIGAEAWKGLES